MWLLFLVFCLALAFSLGLTWSLVWLSSFIKFGQNIREEGPASHSKKSGTPILGGVAIMLSFLIISVIFVDLELRTKALALAFLVLSYFFIGLFDDLIKIFNKRNLGFSASDKFLLQIFFAGLFMLFLVSSGHFIFNPVLYFLFGIFIISGSANAANLSDGLDGLLSGMMIIIFAAISIIALKHGLNDPSVFAAILAGASLGFLYFNRNPAKIFMGDAGSLALGSAMGGLAILIHKEFLLALLALPLVLETLSVIMQVGYYKLTRKRIFKMAPLHHHFELSGFPEKKVVLGFWAFSAFCALIIMLVP